MDPKNTPYEKAKDELAKTLYQELSKKTDYLNLQKKIFKDQIKKDPKKNQTETAFDKAKATLRNLNP